MNSSLKHWREASTVILAARTKSKRGVESLRRDAAAAAGAGLSPTAFDYEVLLLKRSSRSGFMPNAHVFPGGLVDAADFSPEWLDVFKAYRHLPNFGVPPVRQQVETRPPMFATDRLKLGSPIPGDVAFRICAVREAFEEAGVLLAVPGEEAAHGGAGSRGADQRLTELSARWDGGLLGEWRSQVIENTSNFIRMCRELDCLPNIWALHEWGNWLTPTGNQKQRRYDTAFYICCLEETPSTAQDLKEIVQYKWSTPTEILHSFRNRELWIAPPQFYDLGRLCNFPSLSDLHAFARQRSQEGCEQWQPVFQITSDGTVSLLPGDSLYPESSACTGTSEGVRTVEKSLADVHDCPNLHRILIRDLYTVSVQINITPKYQHCLPLSVSHHDKLRTRTVRPLVRLHAGKTSTRNIFKELKKPEL